MAAVDGNIQVVCRSCPWRANGPFERWPSEAVLALEGFKRNQIITKAGRAIMRQAEAPVSFYTVLSGWAFRYILVSGGRQIVDFCLPGDMIGVQAPLLGRVPYAAQALTDVTLCGFAVGDYPVMQRTAPFLAHQLARIAAAESEAIERRLANIGRRSAEARVACQLVELYDRLSARGMMDGQSVLVPLTLEYIADALGLSHVHVSRMLRVLSADGLAHFERGELTILDQEGLRRRAQLGPDEVMPTPILF